MPHGFRGEAVIDRPIDEVFDFLAAGTNDPKFSPRVKEMRRTPDTPPHVGTVFESTVKDAGMKSQRKFELTVFERPTRIRWMERSKSALTVPEGGYDLEALGNDRTRVAIHNTIEGHGLGKLFVPIAAKVAAKDAPALALRIKAAVEAD
jgi:hypothetical protein